MTKQTASPEKTTSHSTGPRADSDTAAGPAGVAVTPPSYGLDVLDQGGFEETVEYEAPEGVLQKQAIGFSAGSNLPEPPPDEAELPFSLQAKLKIGLVDDKYEREADRIADRVMGLPGPALSLLSPPGLINAEHQRKEESDERISRIGLKSFGNGSNAAPEDIEARLTRSEGGGTTLPDNLRAFMEESIGADFNRVRIHTGRNAVQMSKDLGAQAFTHDNDIYFNDSQYNPTSAEGQHLLAHELTHVVQQNNGVQAKLIQRRPVEESKKYDVIDYKKAREDNLASWYDQYKFFDLFKEGRIYPGSTPITYANRVYELQMKLEEVFKGKWSAPEAGILEPAITADGTLIRIVVIAQAYHADPTVDYGFNKEMLERLYKYYQGFEENPPNLVSDYFAGIGQLEAVNRNQYFYIQYGDRGEYVGRIQRALLALNYNLGRDVSVNKDTKEKEVSGVFGKDTKKAVIDFQKDSGFEGKDVDGIVGQKSLRVLDKRIGVPAFKKLSAAAGNAYAFHVPITAADLLVDKAKLEQNLLIRTLKVAFPITDKESDILLRSGWHWINYKGITQADVDLGYLEVSVSKSDYHGVMGKIAEATGQKAEEPVDDKLTGLTLDLLKTGKLYELNERIKGLESTISSIRRSGDPEMHGRDVDWGTINRKRAELERLKKERQEELNRLGITLDEYEKLKTDFINTFEKFAVLLTFRMLSENEMQANIEAQHYGNIKEVAAIKTVLSDLAGKYSELEKLWWEAVSLEETRGKDSAYYKSSTDYYLKNTYIDPDPAGGVVDLSDPTRYYNEKNVADMYKALEKKPSPYFAPWKEKEKSVVTTLQEAVKKFPILAYPKLQLRHNAGKYAAKSDEALQKTLLDIIKGTDDDNGIKQNIEAARKELAENPEKIWELPVVVLRAQYELGLTDGLPVTLIKAKQEAVANKGFWESIGLAVLGIGLGLLALVSGPVGWLALGASIGVGAYDAYRTYKEITFKKETAGTAIDPASALGTEDPSYFWFWVSLVSVGLDVFQAARVVKSVAKGAHLAKGTKEGLEAAREVALKSLKEAGGEATAKGKAILKEIEEIDTALSKVKTSEFAKNNKLLEPLKANPMAVVVMSEALKDKNIVQAVTTLGKLVDKELFENSLKFYASVGRKSLDELPEFVRLIKEGGLKTNKRLMAELLSDPRTQRVLLDTQDPKLIANHFNTWEAAIKAGESQSFVKYLEAKNLSTKLADDTKLVDMFGEAFATLPNAVKNRQILRVVEPRLLDALNAGSLSPEITKGLEVVLNSEILAKSTRLVSAQERMLRELRILGGLIETQTDFSKVVSLLDNPTSRRALWEGASQLAGKERYVEIILKANGGKLPAPDVMDDLIRIGPMTDESAIRSLLTENGLRKVLAENPEAVAVLKKCASPCLPPFVTPKQVSMVAEIMKGKSNDDLLRIREFLYAHRSSEDTFKSALASLETNFAEALKDVKLPVLTKPPRLAVADEALRAIVDLGLPVSVLNNIMKKAAAVKGESAIVTDLMRVLQFEKNVSLKNFDILIKGLAEGNAAEFRAARHLLDEAERFVGGAKGFKYSGLQQADILLGRFSLTELHTMMGARWSEGFVKNLYDVTEKMPGLSNREILDLITKANGGRAPGDLGRLQDILSTIKTPTVTYEEAVKTIRAADEFAASVAKAMKDPVTGYDAMVKLIWGETIKVEGGTIKVKEVLGKSGSEAYQTVFQLGKGDSIAKNIVSGGTMSKEKWKVFRKVIDDANIAPSIKNNIIGEMWTRVNVEYYQGLGYRVYREVEITTGKVTAKADIVLEKGNKLIFVECKSGGATYSSGQETIYTLLEKGQFKNVMLKGDEALVQKFASPSTKTEFVPRRESEIIK